MVRFPHGIEVHFSAWVGAEILKIFRVNMFLMLDAEKADIFWCEYMLGHFRYERIIMILYADQSACSFGIHFHKFMRRD